MKTYFKLLLSQILIWTAIHHTQAKNIPAYPLTDKDEISVISEDYNRTTDSERLTPIDFIITGNESILSITNDSSDTDFSTLSTFTTNGSSTTFSVSSAWDMGLPPNDGTADIVIDHNISLDTNYTLASLTVNVGDTLRINPGIVLKVNGNIINEGLIYFESDGVNGSAQFDEFTAMISGSGEVTVERFIPIGFGIRHITSPVTTSGSIKDNWQEGVNNTSNVFAENKNPNPGFGTHITGADTSKGFDKVISNFSGMRYFDLQGMLTSIPNTNQKILRAGEPFWLFVRGDRGEDVNNNTTVDDSDTRLRSTGSLHTGSLTYDVGNSTDYLELSGIGQSVRHIGNPFQAVVDYREVDRDDLTDYIYVWDNKIGGADSRGGYVTVDTPSDTSVITAPSPWSIEISHFIAPGMTFWVQNLPTNSPEVTAPFSPKVIFEENDKATDATEISVFNTYTNFYINSRMYKTSDLLNGNRECDALGLRFSDNYTTQSSEEDAIKFGNTREAYAVGDSFINGRSIDKQYSPSIGDADIDLITFYGSSLTTTNYSLTFNMVNRPDDIGVFLVDTFFAPGDPEYETELTESIVYDYDIDANDPTSINFFRFKLRFGAPTGRYAWEAEFDDNFLNTRVFKEAPFGNIRTLTVEATSDNDEYRIYEINNNKWRNGSTPLNSEFTLTHGPSTLGNGFMSSNVTTGKYYTVQIEEYSEENRQSVVMETDNPPVDFDSSDPVTFDPIIIQEDQLITINLNGSKSPQEIAYLVYSDDGFTTEFVEPIIFTDPTASSGTATISDVFNTVGKTVEFFVYTTTLAASPGSNHDLYSLAQSRDGMDFYSYTVASCCFTVNDGNFSNPNTWFNNDVPGPGEDFFIGHNVVLDQDLVANAVEITSNGNFTNTAGFLFEIQNGGRIDNNGTFNFTTGTVNFIGGGTVTGEVTFNDVEINGGVDFGNPGDGNQSTVNGSLTILPGSFVFENSPFYGDGSTLVYNTGGDYGRNSEWSNTSATQGRPFNVIVKNGTVLEFATPTNNKTIAAEIDGDFTIEASAAAYMDGGGNNMEAPLIVGGNFENIGNFSLSQNALNANPMLNGDLRVSGDFTNNGGFFFNSKSIFFEGPNNQNLTAANDFEIPYLVIDKTAGEVILQQDIIINGNEGTGLNMSNDGVLNLNDHQLQIGNNTNTQVSFTDNAGLVGSLDSRILFRSSASAGDLSFKQDAAAYENYLSEFEMDGSGNIGISDTLNMLRRFYLKGGNFNSNSHLTFKSSDSITAIIPQVTGGGITGDVRIERHFPQSNRSFRYVSSPVTTSSTINANWQEGATTQSPDPNPNPGFGTHITGSSDPNNTLGFDVTQTGNPSLFTFDETDQVEPDNPWDPVTSTNNLSDVISVGVPYALMVRGDRSTSLTSNDAIGPATTLRTSGEIVTGNQVVVDGTSNAPSGKFVLVGNPYQAQVNMGAIVFFASGIALDYMWIWDPKLGNQGGYATVDLSTGFQVDEDGNEVVPRTSQANLFLQPFQACFLQANAPVQTVTFYEQWKSDSSDNIGTFSDAAMSANVLNIELEQQNTQILVDAVKLSFAPNYTTPGSFEDAAKLWNSTEQLAIVNNSDYFVIDKRNLPQTNDTVPLYLGNYQESQYTLKLESTLESDIPAILYDEYLDQTQVLNFGDNIYNFSIDNAIPASTDNLRFKLVFNPETLGTEDLVSTTPFSVYPNPTDDIIYINSDKTYLGQAAEITCFDQTGRLVLSQSISKLEANTTLDLSPLSAGLYLLKLETESHQETFKIQVK